MSQEWINNPFHIPKKGDRADELKILWEHFKLQNESKRIFEETMNCSESWGCEERCEKGQNCSRSCGGLKLGLLCTI